MLMNPFLNQQSLAKCSNKGTYKESIFKILFLKNSIYYYKKDYLIVSSIRQWVINTLLTRIVSITAIINTVSRKDAESLP